MHVNNFGAKQMGADTELFLLSERTKQPAGHFYTWPSKCITIGYNQKPETLLNLERCAQLGWEVAKRPTGGGMVFHMPGDFSYTIVVPLNFPHLPKGLEASCQYLVKPFVTALQSCGIPAQQSRTIYQDKAESIQDICFAAITRYEVTLYGKKILGSAQRRGRQVLLQQGTLNINRPDSADIRAMAMNQGTADLLTSTSTWLTEAGFSCSTFTEATVKQSYQIRLSTQNNI